MRHAICYVGTSGWSYPHWAKRRFYPSGTKQRDWLRFYADPPPQACTRPCPSEFVCVRPCPSVSVRVRLCPSVPVRVRPCPSASVRARPCPSVHVRVPPRHMTSLAAMRANLGRAISPSVLFVHQVHQVHPRPDIPNPQPPYVKFTIVCERSGIDTSFAYFRTAPDLCTAVRKACDTVRLAPAVPDACRSRESLHGASR